MNGSSTFARALGAAGALAACGPSLLWHGRSLDRRVRVELFERDGAQGVVVDGRAHPRFDAVGLTGLVMSDDGRTVAYPARRAGRWHLVVNGVASAAYEGLGEVVLSPDGAHLAYAAGEFSTLRLSADGEHLAYLRVDDGSVDVVRARAVGVALLDSLTFDAAGARWGCLAGARETRRMRFVFSDGETRPFDWDEVGSMIVRGALGEGSARRMVQAELAR